MSRSIQRARISKEEMDAFPESAIWNAFVNLLAMTDSSDLAPIQIPAHLAFWYNAEVQNGGHLQYLVNRGVDEARIAVVELPHLGATQFSELLEKAIAKWEEKARTRPHTVQEYVGVALEDELGVFDAQFYAMSPSIQEVLEQHLALHMDRYVFVE